MKRSLKHIFIIILFFVSFGCSNTEEETNTLNKTDTPKNLYELAMIELNNESYENALILFEDVNFKFPLSNEAVQSQIMIAFIEYIKMNYTESIFKFSRIINKYPSHKDIDYVYYMRALCYFEQIENEHLDGKNNIKALDNFNQVINRFPNSKYAQDSEQKIILVNENIAAKHMDIAFFYLKQKKYIASMNRYKKVVEKYSKSKFTPEALHRLVEIYYTLGMKEDAEKTAAVISYNYPDSKWYKYSYDLLVQKNKNQTDKKSLIEKLSSLIKMDDEEKE